MGRTQAMRDAIGDRGEAIYAEQLRAKVETPENIGKLIAIDVNTGDYEIDDENQEAARRLRQRQPDAEVFGLRIGYKAAYVIGGILERTAPYEAKDSNTLLEERRREEPTNMEYTKAMKKEIEERGQGLYAGRLRTEVETPENLGKLLTFDVQTGDYEVDDDHLKAVERLMARRPDSQLFTLRLGYDAVYSVGEPVKRTPYYGAKDIDTLLRENPDVELPRDERTEAMRQAKRDCAHNIYEQQLRAKVETTENIGSLIAIDVNTGDYEIDKDELKAVDRIKARRPESDLFVLRIGYDAVDGIGYIPRRTAS